MFKTAARVVGWIFISDPPRTRLDVAALVALPLLVLLGLAALAWPWLTDEAPRAVVAGYTTVVAWIAALLQRIASHLPRPW
jgi:hypothetical protein